MSMRQRRAAAFGAETTAALPAAAAEKKQQRMYHYRPATAGGGGAAVASAAASTGGTTFVLDQAAQDLPEAAQRSLRARGYFHSISGVLYTHRDPRLPTSAPLWVRLLAPTRTLVYTMHLLWLLDRFRVFLLPLLMFFVAGLDPLLSATTNVDGEHAGMSSANFASLLLLSAVSSDLVASAWLGGGGSTGTPLAAPSWFSATFFPVASTWLQLVVWPTGAVIGLLVLQALFPLVSSQAWTAGWVLTAGAAAGVYVWSVPGTYVGATVAVVLAAFTHGRR